MKSVFGIVVSDLTIVGNIESVGVTYDNREDALAFITSLVKNEQGSITEDGIAELTEFSQYITPDETYAYTIVDFINN